eukprot:9487735-Pyramimonas_sp.AAC.1
MATPSRSQTPAPAAKRATRAKRNGGGGGCFGCCRRGGSSPRAEREGLDPLASAPPPSDWCLLRDEVAALRSESEHVAFGNYLLAASLAQVRGCHRDWATVTGTGTVIL